MGLIITDILYFIVICNFVLYILYFSVKLIIGNTTYTCRFFIGKLVIKYLPAYHCLKTTKSIVHAVPFFLNQPLLRVYHLPNTRLKELERWGLCSPRAHSPMWEANKQPINGTGHSSKWRNANTPSAVGKREWGNQCSLFQVIPHREAYQQLCEVCVMVYIIQMS